MRNAKSLTAGAGLHRALGENLSEAVATASYDFIAGPFLRDPYRIGKRLRGHRAEPSHGRGRPSSANPTPGLGDCQSGLDDVEVQVSGLQNAEQRGELALIAVHGEPATAGGVHVAAGQGDQSRRRDGKREAGRLVAA